MPVVIYQGTYLHLPKAFEAGCFICFQEQHQQQHSLPKMKVLFTLAEFCRALVQFGATLRDLNALNLALRLHLKCNSIVSNLPITCLLDSWPG